MPCHEVGERPREMDGLGSKERVGVGKAARPTALRSPRGKGWGRLGCREEDTDVSEAWGKPVALL